MLVGLGDWTETYTGAPAYKPPQVMTEDMFSPLIVDAKAPTATASYNALLDGASGFQLMGMSGSLLGMMVAGLGLYLFTRFGKAR